MAGNGKQKLPAEVFGHPIEDGSEEAQRHRREHWCPFVDGECSKQSRNLAYPFGVCSVWYSGKIVAICPLRFCQGDLVFQDIADHYFGTRHDLIRFPEIAVRARTGRGRTVQYTFDYVVIKHKPLSREIEDFVVVEFQTVDTTSTGALVQALSEFMSGKDVSEQSYNFGMNWANVWKRCFTQILRKGTILEQWGHRIYWVAQEPAYRRLVESYGLYDLSYDRTDATRFMTYDLEARDGTYGLIQTRIESSTIDGLFDAFQHNTPIPSKDAFVRKLGDKVRANWDNDMRLRLETD